MSSLGMVYIACFNGGHSVIQASNSKILFGWQIFGFKYYKHPFKGSIQGDDWKGKIVSSWISGIYSVKKLIPKLKLQASHSTAQYFKLAGGLSERVSAVLVGKLFFSLNFSLLSRSSLIWLKSNGRISILCYWFYRRFHFFETND